MSLAAESFFLDEKRVIREKDIKSEKQERKVDTRWESAV
jgi:hypothetical protein